MTFREPAFTVSFSLTVALAVLLFAVDTAASGPKEKVLYSFKGNGDGKPYFGLIFDTEGRLYGTTDGGYSCPEKWSRAPVASCGTAFQLIPPATKGGRWIETVLHRFRGSDGANPQSYLVQDSAGKFYGTTTYGGYYGYPCARYSMDGCGVVFQLTRPAKMGDGWTETVLYKFTGGTDGSIPVSGVVRDKEGDLYGVTAYGGTVGAGALFKLQPPKKQGDAWTESVLYSFAVGAGPASGVVLDRTGKLYGESVDGVFQMSPPTAKRGVWIENVLYTFKDWSDGAEPAGGVTFDNAGNIYGTTVEGGVNSYGTVFQLTPPGTKGGAWTKTVLHSFPAGTSDGWGPVSGVILDKVGNVYGTTENGGKLNDGTIFKVKRPAAPGVAWIETVLHSFDRTDGWVPAGGLIFDGLGNLDGTTAGGGKWNWGTAFELVP
jgi:uncharacterized repeat protein (TIGR03803 family)